MMTPIGTPQSQRMMLFMEVSCEFEAASWAASRARRDGKSRAAG
jgi:hypothetical protein